MRIVQISDLHMVPPGETLHGLDPAERLRACLADVTTRCADASLVVLSGDLADRGDGESYRALRGLLRTLPAPCCPMLGNHDDREQFCRVFPEIPRDPAGYVQYRRDVGTATLLFLDTLEPGATDGVYGEDRCRWLAAALDRCEGRDVYLFMHHPPFPIGVPGLDRIRLRDETPLQRTLDSCAGVRHLFFGHVHRPVSGSWRGTPFSSLPGTNHQVELDFEHPTFISYTHERPGYAIVDIEPDRTVVHLRDFLDDGPRRQPDGSWHPPLPA